MTARLLRAIFAATALLAAVPVAGFAQTPPPPPPQGAAPATPPPGSAPPAAVFSPEQLDQMLAPIALYPDPLLMQILTAATYPLEVSQAAAWAASASNAHLSSDQLQAALANQDWDPSVKSLVPFPQILAQMSSKLDWLQAVGDAFLAQQGDVMDSIQRLRRAAQAAGTLVSGSQELVTTADQEIEIEPAGPSVLYLPCYNPAAVYGAWPYSAYPPVVLSFWSGCAPGPGLGFGISINIVPWLWGWGSWDWRNHHLRIDAARFDRIDPRREHFSGATWTHDPSHRRGVAYRDPATRTRFSPAPAKAPAPAPGRDVRGFAPAAAPAARPAAAAAPARPAAAPTAFEHASPAPDARAASARGHASLAPPKPAPAPAPHPAVAPHPAAAPAHGSPPPPRPGQPPHP